MDFSKKVISLFACFVIVSLLFGCTSNPPAANTPSDNTQPNADAQNNNAAQNNANNAGVVAPQGNNFDPIAQLSNIFYFDKTTSPSEKYFCKKLGPGCEKLDITPTAFFKTATQTLVYDDSSYCERKNGAWICERFKISGIGDLVQVNGLWQDSSSNIHVINSGERQVSPFYDCLFVPGQAPTSCKEKVIEGAAKSFYDTDSGDIYNYLASSKIFLQPQAQPGNLIFYALETIGKGAMSTTSNVYKCTLSESSQDCSTILSGKNSSQGLDLTNFPVVFDSSLNPHWIYPQVENDLTYCTAQAGNATCNDLSGVNLMPEDTSTNPDDLKIGIPFPDQQLWLAGLDYLDLTATSNKFYGTVGKIKICNFNNPVECATLVDRTDGSFWLDSYGTLSNGNKYAIVNGHAASLYTSYHHFCTGVNSLDSWKCTKFGEINWDSIYAIPSEQIN